jgi:hypothetical protein
MIAASNEWLPGIALPVQRDILGVIDLIRENPQ